MKKLLLDECIPHRVRYSLAEFETYTVGFMKWEGIKNGKLLKLAVENNFDFFLTTDKNIYFQQNLDKTPLTIIVFDVVRIDAELIGLLLPQFKQNIESYKKHTAYLLG